jgi:hypothetical protein
MDIEAATEIACSPFSLNYVIPKTPSLNSASQLCEPPSSPADQCSAYSIYWNWTPGYQQIVSIPTRSSGYNPRVHHSLKSTTTWGMTGCSWIMKGRVLTCSEWLTHQHRDTLASIVGHPPLLAYISIADGECLARERFEVIEVSYSFIVHSRSS